MAEDRYSPEEQQYIEEIGLYFEKLGLPRMPGRILGRLLICDPPHQSLQELADALQASKGSISTSTRMLIQAGFVERMSFPKDRNDYYQLKSNIWSHHFKRQMESIVDFKILIQKGMTMLEHEPLAKQNRLKEMLEFYEWLEETMPSFMTLWEQHKNKKKN
ncbi:MAG: MarR family transcriptional regulator [Fibrobacteria bacterium]|nr:MarR family transcriptional regulator [Fibrobacteria bacterium]